MTLKHTQCLQDDIGAIYTLIPVLDPWKKKNNSVEWLQQIDTSFTLLDEVVM